jgi:Arc/MetJ-type ribon-helix-helix transcriptional regulator
MNVRVSLPVEDLAFVDDYAARTGSPSRSAVLHRAVELLRSADMESAYAEAWQEWDANGEAEHWEPAAADGLGDAPR